MKYVRMIYLLVLDIMRSERTRKTTSYIYFTPYVEERCMMISIRPTKEIALKSTLETCRNVTVASQACVSC